MIDSKTGLLGLIGNPVKHSLSPIFMNYLLEKLDINYKYFTFELESTKLKDAINGFKVLRFKGINVTIPFKRDVVSLVDKVNDDAGKIGAINCILNKDGFLTGFNTDHLGFIWPLEKHRDSIEGSNVLMIGCGGAARAVLYALKNLKVRTILIVNRTKLHALEFIGWAKTIIDPTTKIIYVGDNQSVDDYILKDVKLIINTTPVGMSPFIDRNPLPDDLKYNRDQIVYDIIYTPWETELLKKARQFGGKTINGLPMLIAQGIYSLDIWFKDAKGTKFSFDMFSLYDELFLYTKNYLLERK